MEEDNRDDSDGAEPVDIRTVRKAPLRIYRGIIMTCAKEGGVFLSI